MWDLVHRLTRLLRLGLWNFRRFALWCVLTALLSILNACRLATHFRKSTKHDCFPSEPFQNYSSFAAVRKPILKNASEITFSRRSNFDMFSIKFSFCKKYYKYINSCRVCKFQTMQIFKTSQALELTLSVKLSYL